MESQTSSLENGREKGYKNYGFNGLDPMPNYETTLDGGDSSQVFQGPSQPPMRMSPIKNLQQGESTEYSSLESQGSTDDETLTSHQNSGPLRSVSLFFAKIWAGFQKYGLIIIIGLAALFILINAVLPGDKKSKIFSPRTNTEDAEFIPMNATNNLSMEEIVHRHSITIDSPLSLPYELPPVTLELHLAPRRKFKWSNWNVSNLEAVESLVLEGPLDEEDIRFLILSMPNLNSVSIILDKGMCSIVDSVEDEKLNEHINIQSLKVSGMETCHNLFAFIARTFHFSKLESITLEDVPVMFENMGFIHELLKTHRETLRRLFLINVVVCHHCFLFDKVFLRWVDEARFKFLRPESLPAKKSLENFNLGTPRIAHFESNVRCSEDERKTYLSN
ncbi:unnamed protein product, partial [Allacma fusca]